MRNLHVNKDTNSTNLVAGSDNSGSSMLPPSQSSGLPSTSWEAPSPVSGLLQLMQNPLGSEQSTSMQPSISSSHISTPNLSQLPTSSQQTYSQAMLRAPTPGLQDISNLTENTVSDVSESEKSQWRQYTDPADFFHFTGWSKEHLEIFLKEVSMFRDLKKSSFTEWLLEKAWHELIQLRRNLKRVAGSEQIRWDRIFDEDSETNAIMDDLVYVWVQVKRVDYLLSKAENKDLLNVLVMLLPKVKPAERRQGYEVAVKAFHAEEKPTADGRQPSDDFCGQLLQSYGAYDPQLHLSPYVSIVGPSGIGKSFMIQQMAVRYGVYVMYTSLARLDSGAYPSRSMIASMIPKDTTRDQLVEFWNIFIAASLAEVEGCREVGITATGLYNLQTKDDYDAYQGEFSNRVLATFNKRSGLKDKKPSLKDAVLGPLETRAGGRWGPLLSWCEALDRNGDNEKPTTPKFVAQKTTPSTLFCFDEARELTDDKGSLTFRSLRQALRNCFDRSSIPHKSSLPGAAFLAAFLDTNSKITNFSPPAHADDSQKIMAPTGHGQQLLPPIYAIDTIDVFRDDDYAQQPQDGSVEAALKLFRLARPLWGSRYNSANNNGITGVLYDILQLAKRKTDGDSVAKTLALLSYRLQFYVTGNQVAEQMVASCLRYVLYVNPARDMMRTIHPSEPVLAYTSAVNMINPVNRLRILQQFVTSCFEGSIDAGDIGEMVASLILMFAYDEVQFKNSTVLPVPIPLGDFMASLLGEEQRNIMAERASTDSDMKKLWEKGLVFFNHFVRTKEYPAEGILERAYERGAAFFPRENFPGIDLIIPIKVPDADMTFLAIQVKNRKDDNAHYEIKRNASSSMKKASDKLKWERAHIGIMMCLRHDSSATERFYLLKPEPKTAAAGRSTRVKREGNASDTTTYKWPAKNKELLVMTLGLDEHVYPSINLCQGKRTEESNRIPPLLERVLDCVPGISLPGNAHMYYADKLFFS